MRIRSRRTALLVSFVLANTACSSSDDAGAGAGGAGNSGGNGASGGAAGGGNAAGASGHAGAAGNAGFAGFGGGGAGSPGSGGTAGGGGGGGGGTGGWAGGTTGKVLVDDPTAARTWPAAHGDALISLWHDDAIAALTITIDDNTAPDHTWWLQQAQAYGLKLTWFVITNHIPSSFGGTWPGFASLVAAGHDVQSHTVSHLNDGLTLDDEYKLSQQDIEKNLPNVKAVTLAYPGGNHPISNDPKVAAKYYLGARSGIGHNNKIGATDYMMVNSISGQLNLATDHWAGLPNIVVKNPAQAKSFRAWHCVHYHLMQDKTNALAGFQWIAAHKNDLWVGLFRETVLYGRERESATLSVPHVSADKVVVEANDTLPDSSFDFPLTVKIGLDATWMGATASQNGNAVAVKIVQHSGKPFALVTAVPDRGPGIVSRKGGPLRTARPTFALAHLGHPRII
ncbi:MAG TPA: polysaccharide deacetylase family protein [Polyangiaceae bacterium]|nr:polysaccharide deacetylase family protein [Polyangiaceae bacterium]